MAVLESRAKALEAPVPSEFKIIIKDVLNSFGIGTLVYANGVIYVDQANLSAANEITEAFLLGATFAKTGNHHRY